MMMKSTIYVIFQVWKIEELYTLEMLCSKIETNVLLVMKET